MRSVFALAALSAISLAPVVAQEERGPAPVIQIIREAVKEGKGPVHEKTEAEFVRAMRKAKFPGYYYGMTASSGSNEAWFINVYPSFAAAEEYQKEMQKEPLKSEFELADSHDGTLRDSTRTMWAVYRPDMSYRPEKFEVAKAHYVAVGTMRVKLGKEEDFADGAKMYIATHEKANTDLPFLGYQVVEGAPAGTYLFFSVMESLKTMDGEAARRRAFVEAMGEDNYKQFAKGSGDVFQLMENNLFAMNPRMSYVPKEVEDADPAYWKPKPAVKKVTEAAPKKEEKPAEPGQ